MISDEIEKILMRMLSEEGGRLVIKRNEFADKVGCVPSQINYVITSRFTPEKGYVIESRRGGGGYIMITRKMIHKNEYLMHMFCSVGDEIDSKTLKLYIQDLSERKIITKREEAAVKAVMSLINDDKTRADALKKVLLAFAD